MSKAEETSKERGNRESDRNSRIVPLFSREQVDKSVLVLVACGELLSPTVRVDHGQWIDIRARAHIAAKISTICESQLGMTNTSYGKAKFWAELAARWMVSVYDTIPHMERARKAILDMLRAHPPSDETVLKTFQIIYNRARKDVKKGNVPIVKLAPYVSQLPSSQDQITVQALRFARASAHALKWSDYLELTAKVKRQLDIIKRFPSVVIIFNRLTLQLREDWEQQWANFESDQILAFYEMICEAHPIQECHRYIEALVGVCYSLCKGQNIMNQWLYARLKKIRKKCSAFRIKNCVSIEDINTFSSAYMKSDIPIDDVYRFLSLIYTSLKKAARKLVNLVIEQTAVSNYSHAINFGVINGKTMYSCIPYLLKKVSRAQWSKIAQVAVDLHHDPWHAVIKAKTTEREFIDLANFGHIGMSLLNEKFKNNFEGFIHDGNLSKKEILDLIEKARGQTSEGMEEVLRLDGILIAPTLHNMQLAIVEDRIFTLVLPSQAISKFSSNDKEEMKALKKSEPTDFEEEINSAEEEQDTVYSDTMSARSLEREIPKDYQDKVFSVLEKFKKRLGDIIDERISNSTYKVEPKIELEETQERLKRINEPEQDILQTKINTLICLDKDIHVIHQNEQKKVLEQLNEKEEAFLQRFKKISIDLQNEDRTSQRDELNNYLEEFSKQQGVKIEKINNSFIRLPQKAQIDQENTLNDFPETFSEQKENKVDVAPELFREQQKQGIQQRHAASRKKLERKVNAAEQKYEKKVVLKSSSDQKKNQDSTLEISQETSVVKDRIILGLGDLPKPVKKFSNIGVEIKKNQLPELYGRAMAVVQDIKAAHVICKYLNIIGKRSVFHPFVKKHKRMSMPNRFRPIPEELRDAAAVFGVKLHEHPVEDNLSECSAKKVTKAPRSVIWEVSPDDEQYYKQFTDVENSAVVLDDNLTQYAGEDKVTYEYTKTPVVESFFRREIKEFLSDDEQYAVFANAVAVLEQNVTHDLNEAPADGCTNASKPDIKPISSDVGQHSEEVAEKSTMSGTIGFDDPVKQSMVESSANELKKAPKIEDILEDIKPHAPEVTELCNVDGKEADAPVEDNLNES